jgi:soluble lytic murein transglycosylase
MVVSINKADNSAGPNQTLSGWMIKRYDTALAASLAGDYRAAISTIEPAIQRLGGNSPAEYLKLYYPLPPKLLSIVIANLPDHVKALPEEQQVQFIFYYFAMVRRESLFDPANVSYAGAIGLGQIMPETAFWLADKINLTELNESNYETILRDPEKNIRLSVYYFGWLVKTYGLDRVSACLAAYNAGQGNISEILKKPGEFARNLEAIPEAANYVRHVRANFRQYQNLHANEVRGKLRGTAIATAPPRNEVKPVVEEERSILAAVKNFFFAEAIASAMPAEQYGPYEHERGPFISADEIMSKLLHEEAKPPRASVARAAARPAPIKSRMTLVIAGYAATRETAGELKEKLINNGIEDCFIVPEPQNGRFRVQAGAFRVPGNAQNRLADVRRFLPAAFIVPPQ